uniref:Serine/threonine kinase 3 n=1 Tax=Oncorhynchus kisutch TaxID=8019 RepID=A0A8C7F6J3_ONCKI
MLTFLPKKIASYFSISYIKLPADPVPQFFKLKKLSEDSLTKQPEEVFDVLEKLGEGSYGSVFKAIHKESGQVVAIKQVPVESDLQEIIKEISIMQQCDRYSTFIRQN